MKKNHLIFVTILLLTSCQSAATIYQSTPSTSPAARDTLSSPEPVIENNATPHLAALGERVAYIRAGDIHLWQEATGSVRLTDSGDVAHFSASADGELIAFTRLLDPGNDRGGEELWSIRADGGNLQRWVSAAELDALHPGRTGKLRYYEFIPGTHRLLFTTAYHLAQEDYGQPAPEEPASRDLQMIDLDSGERRMLLQPGEGGFTFSVSPDGQSILLVNPAEILLVDADGANRRQMLTFDKIIGAIGDSESITVVYHLPRPVWSADASFFLMAIPPGGYINDVDPTRIWRFSPTGEVTLLMEVVAGPVFFDPMVLSPDGSQVGYLEVLDAMRNIDNLHIVNLGSGEDQIVCENGCRFEAWAPDSRHFAYRQGKEDVMYVGSPEDGFTAIPGCVFVGRFRWVNDRQFLMGNCPPEDARLWLGDVTGKLTLIASSVPGDLGVFAPLP